jgi:hypothetical protein
MTGLLIVLGATSGIAWLAIALRGAWARTQPDLLLAIARPEQSAEHTETLVTAELLAGTIDAKEYRRRVGALAAADVPELIRR